MRTTENKKHLLGVLQHVVSKSPDKIVYREIKRNEETAISYNELYQRVAVFSESIKNLKSELILLLFNESIDFVVAFLACQASGKIPVPMFYPSNKRYFERLQNIISDSGCAAVVCSEKEEEKIRKGLKDVGISLHLICESKERTEAFFDLEKSENPVAFIQYTSGSTGNPKGVVVSQKNLMHNQKLIQETFGCDENSVILSWLPFYHDMGLIGNLLHTIYVGCSAILLSPVDVVQNPLIWLEQIEKYRVTHSGGPNFIFDKCVESVNTAEGRPTDLSSWKVAYNGSEPIKVSTIQNFTDKFETWGFRKDAFKTCYGLAEATLIVSGGAPVLSETTQSVGSGKICNETSVIFFDKSSGDVNGEHGEICISGDSITEGYWKKENAEYFIEWQGRKYLRTGDTGRLEKEQLIVTGREKEMIILNGRNYYPYDLEEEIAESVHQVDKNGVGITQLETEDGGILVIAELSRRYLSEKNSYSEIARSINNKIKEVLGINPFDIVLLSPRKLPRTSSGKIQRLKLKELYRENQFDALYQSSGNSSEGTNALSHYLHKLSEDPYNASAVDDYLVELIRIKLSLSIDEAKTIRNANFYELGVSSLAGVDIVHQINRDLNIQIEVGQVFELGDLQKIRELIISILWIKAQPSTQQEIEL